MPPKFKVGDSVRLENNCSCMICIQNLNTPLLVTEVKPFSTAFKYKLDPDILLLRYYPEYDLEFISSNTVTEENYIID